MPRLKVRNLCYMLVATICLLLYYNALVPSKNDNNDNNDELVNRWIEKKLDIVLERDKRIENGTKVEEKKESQSPKKETQKKVNSNNKNTKKGETGHKDPASKQDGEKQKTGARSEQSKESIPEWMKRMHEVQVKRKAHLRKLCDQLKRPLKSMEELGSYPKQLRPLIINDKHKFIYSIVYKAGSTNWERVIIQDLEGFKNVPNQQLFSHKALRWMPGFTPDQAKERLRNYTKFIFVRNPLSRILSAYKDKFVDHHNVVFTKMAKTIIGRFRKGPHNDSAIDVTFPEFMAFLVNSSRSNPHWKVVFNQNFPCRLNYDIIGKLEEADDDIPFVLRRIGIHNLTSYGSAQMKKKGADERLWAQYYPRVPQDIMKQFYNIYKHDFTLFGYDMPTSF